MKRRRHSTIEIATMLDEADAMSNQGRAQEAIAKALGISIATYHRWRRTRASSRLAPASRHDPKVLDMSLNQTSQINDLQVENSRLRRLVTDLLLEKINIEENARNHGLDSKPSAPR